MMEIHNRLFKLQKQRLIALTLGLGLGLGMGGWVGVVYANDKCPHRGDLDDLYCDTNHNLVADAAKPPHDPSELVIGIAQVEDAITATKTYGHLVDYLKTCTGKPTRFHAQVGENSVLGAMRSGKVHIGQFATGGTMLAVNYAGAIPFAAKGTRKTGKPDQYTLMLIVRQEHTARKPTDLIGKVVAHTKPSSNSGNLAPRALFPELGLTPDRQYKVEFSGSHDKSIMGVARGLYDAAAVASDVFERMEDKGEIKASQFRVLYQSEPFPPDTFTYAHTLSPELAQKIKQCFAKYTFPESMVKQLEGNDHFYPVDYERDWRLVRLIAKASGQKLDKATILKQIGSQN